MCLPNYRRGDGVFLLPSPDTEPPPPTRTHPWHPSRRRVARVTEYVRMYVTCYYGFSPRRASHRRISTRKQCRKTQTHTDIPSGCTQDHWQAVIESVSIWVSLVAMNECLTWISHTTWWMSTMRLKNACFEYMLVHKLAVSYKSHIRQTNQTIRSAKARPNFSITGSEWSLNRSFL